MPYTFPEDTLVVITEECRTFLACSEGAPAEGLPGLWQQLHLLGLERSRHHNRRVGRSNILDHDQSLVSLAGLAMYVVFRTTFVPSDLHYCQITCLSAHAEASGCLSTPTGVLHRYTLMPRGDFVTRNSFYEALCAGSIPVVMDQDYFMHCAFSSVIDYSDFLRTIPEADFMGDESKNVLELLSGMHDATAAIKSLHSLWEVRISSLAVPACAGCVNNIAY